MTKVTNRALASKFAKAAAAALNEVARDPHVPISIPAGATTTAALAVQAEVDKQIRSIPELAHVTSTEPWYQKRSRWSAIVSGGAVVLAPLILNYTGWNFGLGEQALVTEILTFVGGIVAAYLAYRAGTASKPLGA